MIAISIRCCCGYQLKPGVLLDILLVDGRLYARITFAADETGRITRLVLYQNGQDITAERLITR